MPRLQTIPAALVLFGICLWPPSCAAESAEQPLGLPPLSVPADNPLTQAKIALGRKLFFDTRLSRDGSISCSSCHRPERAFTDGRVLAEGIGKRRGTRNAPTLLNAAFNTTQFWDGRRDSLEAQAQDPLVNPREHGLPDYPTLLRTIGGDPAYANAFREAFSVAPDAIRMEHIGKAIASFERTLLAADSPFDRYAYGQAPQALSAEARRGLALFEGAARCASCHLIGRQYALLSDNAFHSVNVGLQRIAPRLAELTTRLVDSRKAGLSLDQTVLSEEDLAELGRFAVTLNPVDIGRFRTPSLRNVALTAPYMHDGSVATLAEAVDMELYNRGTDAGRPLILTPAEKSDLVSFLVSLTSPAATTLLPQERPAAAGAPTDHQDMTQSSIR